MRFFFGKSQFITVQHTSGHVKVSTVFEHHARSRLLCIDSIKFLTLFILQPHLMHVIDRQRELFQQVNTRPHTARVAMDYLEQNNINVSHIVSWYCSPFLLQHLASWSSVWGGGCRWNTRLSSWSHRCSMGFKSGDLEGHGTNFNMTGSVLNCDKLTFSYLSSEIWTVNFSIIYILSRYLKV
jgi:hypothetical protein